MLYNIKRKGLATSSGFKNLSTSEIFPENFKTPVYLLILSVNVYHLAAGCPTLNLLFLGRHSVIFYSIAVNSDIERIP